MKFAIILFGGIVFGLGLALSGMAQQERILGFLQFRDFGLLFLMGGGVGITALAYQLGPRLLQKPWRGHFEPFLARLHSRTFVGAILFGIGWGISGICPGSALTSLGLGNYPILLGIAGMFLGAYAQGFLFPEREP